jgi:signal recognition particle receptor subunit beta
MQQIKVVVTGPFGAGKTQFINTISEIDVVTTERNISMPERRVHKDQTTVAMDFGRITIKKDLVLELYGTPGQRRFDFMFPILSKGMWGFVVVVDSAGRESFKAAREVLHDFDRLSAVPRVIAANKQDAAGALGPDELRKVLDIAQGVPVLPCIATDKTSVRKVLLGLLSSMLGEAGSG